MALRSLQRAFDVAFPLLLIGFLLLPAFREHSLPGRLLAMRKSVANVMRPLSLAQQWGMYAPDPARSMSHMTLTAHDLNGIERELNETALARTAFGTTWAGEKTRLDIWRYRLVLKGIRRANRGRTWFLRGICVREAREGHDPKRIQMFQYKRVFRPPDQVRAGKSEYFAPKVTKSESGWCRSKVVRRMIERDRAVNPWAYAERAAEQVEPENPARPTSRELPRGKR